MSEWNAKYFDREEFCCSCGCGFDTVDYELLRVLEYMREHFDSPITITSACRCKDHNKKVFGSYASLHLQGRAADIVVKGVPPNVVAELAEQMEVGGLGRYKTFTHIDTRTGHARWSGD